MRESYDRITTTIEREWLAEIVAGTKKIEYRQIKPYWTKRFGKVSVPFELRLLNVKKVLGFKHWDKRQRKPKR
jgi:hypothetical protein